MLKLYIIFEQENFLSNLVENPVTKELIRILPMKIKTTNTTVLCKTTTSSSSRVWMSKRWEDGSNLSTATLTGGTTISTMISTSTD